MQSFWVSVVRKVRSTSASPLVFGFSQWCLSKDSYQLKLTMTYIAILMISPLWRHSCKEGRHISILILNYVWVLMLTDNNLFNKTPVCNIHSYFFSSVAQTSPTFLWPHGLQQARPPYPSPIPGAYLNSCPLSQWCHPTISSSVIPFSSCLQ